MQFSQAHETRCREVGYEIFKRARSAMPWIWQVDWWQERLNQFMMAHEALKVQTFRFVDVLPSLIDSADIARHLREYLDPVWDSVPLPGRLGLAYRNPESVWGRTVGACSRFGASLMARRYVTGTNADEAIANAERLRAQNMAFTMDVLGEATRSDAQADRYAATYVELIDKLSIASRAWREHPVIDRCRTGPMPKVNISIKLTSLDPHFDAIDPVGCRKRVFARLRPIFRLARERGVFMNIDMESYKHRNLTLDLFETLMMEPEFRDWDQIGIVLQAYLQDGEQDLARLLGWIERRGTPVAVRLVKGAYWDSETVLAGQYNQPPPVWTRKWESDATYERMARRMLENARLLRPAFASHNIRSLASLITSAKELGLTSADYEVQMLFGMGNPLKKAMVDMGQCLRVYCPYGDLMPGMAYLIRRLLENTANDSFLKQGFADRSRYDELLLDPTVACPPSAPLPRLNFQDPDEEWPMLTFENVPPFSFNTDENRKKMRDAIAYVRGELGQSHPLVIANQPVSTTEWLESLNPAAPTEIIGRVASATPAHADRAVAAAEQAWDSWRLLPARERARFLNRAADLMLEKRLELSAYVILETGKPWREAEADLREAVDYIRFYSEYTVWLDEHPRVRSIPGESNVLTYEPRGVCAVLAPWSFPLAMLLNQTAAALAAGNCVIMKPSSKAAVVAAKVFDIFRQAGLPSGVLNFLPGRGEAVGRHLVDHLDVHVVSFTGSVAHGLEIIRQAGNESPGQRHIKKVIADMSAKNAIIVDHDADLDGAMGGIIESAFAYAGQKCTACSRVIVLAPVYDEFCRKLAEAVQSVTVGPAEEPGTLVGPVIGRTARDGILAAVRQAKKEGRVLVEIDVSELSAGGGYYVGPTVICDVTSEASVAQEEIFGPVLAVLKAKDFDDALGIANDSKYALTGGVYSRSPKNLDRARREFHVGNLYINRKITGSRVNVQPFGGYKLSGMGTKAGSPDYLLQFVHQRTITENTLRHGLTSAEEAKQQTVH
ncbi:MAG: proline dehydrogenase family protein [Phycisphaerae bacterium]|nr:proline dehydrogenase family protein [Phycisphaerae bacterium]